MEVPRSAGAAPEAPPRPAPADEHRHPPGGEQLWNESWYFDVISRDQRIGAYVRLGLTPNLGLSWITAMVCGPGRPTVAVVDGQAPLPDGEQLVVTSGDRQIELNCLSELQVFQVRVTGAGAEYREAAALLRGEAGTPVPVGLDLTWETAGQPYAYRRTTRYEIPCCAVGTLRIGDEEVALAGTGQRDHSWGVRDWWSAEWMWSAGSLEDGERLHGLVFRLPGRPPLGVGYRQPAQGGIHDARRVTAAEEAGPDGLITRARIGIDELDLEVTPLAFGPLRIEAPDGRVSEFPRAMCRLTAADGRSGVAWVEWNRNRSLS
ncbi:MAG TPA: hypothetical protein VE983_09020 [Solirubrobacteraceae bacterium]|nr:hypothetical protein [Solirubrobacteraceae bacterium]